MTIRVALVGAAGRMGTFTERLLESQADLELCSRIEASGDLPGLLADSGAQVGLDFTMAGLGAEHGLAMLAAGLRPLIGTSGVTPEEDRRLDAAAREAGLAGLVVPNFCLGVWLQQDLARRAATFLPSVEIIEEHHHTKPDAPSGTAADTAAQLAELKGVDPAAIPIHSVRLEGLYSNQSVLLGGPGEVLRITHQTEGLEAFGPGILAALRYLVHAQPGVLRGIGHAFEWQRGHG